MYSHLCHFSSRYSLESASFSAKHHTFSHSTTLTDMPAELLVHIASHLRRCTACSVCASDMYDEAVEMDDSHDSIDTMAKTRGCNCLR